MYFDLMLPYIHVGPVGSGREEGWYYGEFIFGNTVKVSWKQISFTKICIWNPRPRIKPYVDRLTTSVSPNDYTLVGF
jgi:hypothetical protein